MSQRGTREELDEYLEMAWEGQRKKREWAEAHPEKGSQRTPGALHKPTIKMDSTPGKLDRGWFLAALMALGLFVAAPKLGRGLSVIVLIAMGGCVIHPIWELKIVKQAPSSAKRNARFVVLLLLALVVIGIFGTWVWPPIRRHVLAIKERTWFEKPLKSQSNSELLVQIGCPIADEKTCVYANQFINMFGESGWNVQTSLSRITLSKAAEGIVVYRRGGDKQAMEQRWNAGGWFNLNEPRLLAVQSAFRSIHIEIDGGTNPEISDNVMMIYFGPEKEDESKPTWLTTTTDWANGKIKGPLPSVTPQ